MLILHGYFRSSAAYRVRIGLNLKGAQYQGESVHLRNEEQQSEKFLELNPQGLVPVLDDEGVIITQSLAILEYLDEKYPDPPLLPKNETDRAYVRSIALTIACDIHPLNNLRILRYLEYNFNLNRDQINQWYRHWIATEFLSLEAKLSAADTFGRFCFGDTPTMADVCLVPQMANARRFDCDLDAFPILVEIDGNCRRLVAFQKAAPEHQPDAE